LVRPGRSFRISARLHQNGHRAAAEGRPVVRRSARNAVGDPLPRSAKPGHRQCLSKCGRPGPSRPNPRIDVYGGRLRNTGETWKAASMDTSTESPADFLVGQRFPYVSLVAATGGVLERDDFARRVRRRAAPCAQHPGPGRGTHHPCQPWHHRRGRPPASSSHATSTGALANSSFRSRLPPEFGSCAYFQHACTVRLIEAGW
jgi:hypothetical protein